MKDRELFFSKIERYIAPSTILFRSIELKLLKERLGGLFKSKSILDLGCGDGIAAAAIFDKRIDYGLDVNPISVKQAKKGGACKKVILASATDIPLEDNSVDLVFSNCTIEHIKDLGSVLKEVSRILVKNGLFIFTTPSHCFGKYSIFSYFNLKRLAQVYGKLRDKKHQHYHSHSIEEWSSILKDFNFKVINGYYYMSKEALEFWDFLLILYVPLYLPEIINKQLSRWIYETFFRKRIYKYFIKARVTDSNGAAVCIVAQKI